MIARLYKIYKENLKKLAIIALMGLAAYYINNITLYSWSEVELNKNNVNKLVKNIRRN
jgi:hypothetical protein